MIAKYHRAAGLLAHALAGCGTRTTTTALADRHVEIINNSGDTTTDFQRSTAGASTRKEDRLAADILPTGRSVSINFDDGPGYCNFDFKAACEGGAEQAYPPLDVGTTTSCTIS